MQPTWQEEPLERLLREGKADADKLRQFHASLLESIIYVFGTAPVGHRSGETIPAGAAIQVRSWRAADGSPYIPVFTSLAILRHAVTEEKPYLALPCRDFMAVTLGQPLIVNPNSAFAYRLDPKHVQSLLQFGAVVGQLESWTVEKTTEIFVREAHDVPQAILGEVGKLLSSYSAIVAARLLYYRDPARDPAPVLLLVLEGEGALQECGDQAARLLVARLDGKIVDVLRVHPGEDRQRFQQFAPFYKR